MEIEGVRRALRSLTTPESGFEDLLAKLDRLERGTPEAQRARKPATAKRRPKAA